MLALKIFLRMIDKCLKRNFLVINMELSIFGSLEEAILNVMVYRLCVIRLIDKVFDVICGSVTSDFRMSAMVYWSWFSRCYVLECSAI